LWYCRANDCYRPSPSTEEELRLLCLSITWTQLGSADRCDIDDYLAYSELRGEKRLQLVDIWKRHPSKQQSFQPQSKYIVGFLYDFSVLFYDLIKFF